MKYFWNYYYFAHIIKVPLDGESQFFRKFNERFEAKFVQMKGSVHRAYIGYIIDPAQTEIEVKYFRNKMF